MRVKPYSCHNCEKTFLQSSSLKTHMVLHSDLRPFSCTMCDLNFKLKCTLKSHTRIRTGEGYPCLEYDKSFANPWKRNIHQQKHRTNINKWYFDVRNISIQIFVWLQQRISVDYIPHICTINFLEYPISLLSFDWVEFEPAACLVCEDGGWKRGEILSLRDGSLALRLSILTAFKSSS